MRKSSKQSLNSFFYPSIYLIMGSYYIYTIVQGLINGIIKIGSYSCGESFSVDVYFKTDPLIFIFGILLNTSIALFFLYFSFRFSPFYKKKNKNY